MNTKRFFGASIAAAAISYTVGSISGYLTQSLYDPVSGLWRAMFTPTWTYSIIASHLALGFLLAGAYTICHLGLGKKAELAKKGLLFGVLAWLLKDIPGSIFTYAFMPVSLSVALAWAVSGLIVNLLAGLAIAYTLK